MAMVLMITMLITSVVPMAGMAQIFDLGLIDDLDSGENLDDYLATASVAVRVDESRSDKTIELASDSDYTGYAEVVVQTEVKVTAIATASDAAASDSDWNTVKDEVAQAIAGKITMKATISDADERIAEYVSLESDQLNSEGLVTVNADASGASELLEGEYTIRIKFTPEVDESELPEGFVISSSKAVEHEITVIVGNSAEEVSEITFKDFDTGKETGKTWIYVGDDPVDLKDYCITELDVSDISFRSDNPSAASVDGTVLTPKANGRAVITAEIKDGDKIVASGKLQVDVWTTETTTENMPPAFEVYEGGTWTHVFDGSIASRDGGFTAIFKKDGTKADVDTEARVSIQRDEVNHKSTVEVKGKKAGEYTLRCAWHGDNNVTYFGYVDFTVKEAPYLPGLKISFNGFNEDDKVNAEGIISTWTYLQQGPVQLKDYCSVEAPADAVITFKSSNTDIATIDDFGWMYPRNIGKTVVTATVTAAGYEAASATMNVQVWDAKEQNNLPREITMRAGETWTQTFAEALSGRTKVFVYDKYGETVDESAVKAFFSADFKTITVKAQKVGSYRLLYRSHKEENNTTKYEEMFIEVLGADVSLDISADQLTLEPGETKTFDVTYSPTDAELKLDYAEDLIKAVYADGKVTVTAAEDLENQDEAWLGIILMQGDNALVYKEIPVYIVKKQLEATKVDAALAEASAKLAEALSEIDETGEIPPAVYKIVDEVAETLAAAPKTEVQANKDAIDQLEETLSAVANLDVETHDDTEIEVAGGLLNLISMGETDGKVVVKPVEDTANTAGVTVDIKLMRGSNGKNITKLAAPMQLKLKVSGIDLTKHIRIKHTKESGSVEWIYPAVEGEYLVFWVDSYSTFAISNYTTSSGGSGGGGGGGSRSTSAAGIISNDTKKGYVNSLTGIITGSGAGYSKWNQDENGWKLQYADGTFAAGTEIADENGSTHEQIVWEMINGAWYPFGSNGYVKSGLVYDAALGGTFYVDINSGMKTGWQQVDGVWRYFSTVSDGKRGIMLVNTTVDGYYINEEGIWM